MADAKRDENRVTTLLAVSNADGITPVVLWADPTTHRLLVDLPTSGSGDVVGPASSTDNALARYDGATGKLLQDSSIIVDDVGSISIITQTAGSSAGSIYKGTISAANRFIHSYHGINSSGFNFFAGLASGNFTMDGATFNGSYNTGVGSSTLAGLTSGYYNTVFGSSSGSTITSGNTNSIFGSWAFGQSTISSGNSVFGSEAAQYCLAATGIYGNCYFGQRSGRGVTATTTSSYNAGFGNYSGTALTTGNYNFFGGHYAGYTTTSGTGNIIIGSSQSPTTGLTASSATASNELNIGGVLFGDLSTGKFGFDLTDATSATATLHPAASTTAKASLRIPDGVAPTSPNDGDIWSDGTDLFFRNATSQKIVTDTNTLTISGKTLTAPRIANSGFIADANGNELIIFTTIASAVNEITFANSATGGSPKFSATGGDTNIGIDFQTKGTGTYRLLGTSSQAAELRLYEDTDDGSNYTAFKVGTQTSDITYTLPTAAPSVSGQVLSATTAGVMSWTTVGATPKMKISTAFETAARFTLAASGGVGTFSNLGYDIDTTSTATRYASAKLRAPDANFSAFAGSPTFSASFILATKGTTASAYIGIGTVTVSGTGHTFTNNHIGFKVIITGSTATLYATQGDGSTENASSALTTLASNDSIDVICVVNGTASVDYYWRKNGGSLSSATNLTSNLPTATTETMGQFSLANDSTASQTTMYFNSASYER